MDECVQEKLNVSGVETERAILVGPSAVNAKLLAVPFTNHLNIGSDLYCMQNCEWIPLPLLKVCHFTVLFLFVQWKHFQRKLKQDMTLFLQGWSKKLGSHSSKMRSWFLSTFTPNLFKILSVPLSMDVVCFRLTQGKKTGCDLQTCFGHSAHIWPNLLSDSKLVCLLCSL